MMEERFSTIALAIHGLFIVYTMNKPWIARAIVENLSSIIKLGE